MDEAQFMTEFERAFRQAEAQGPPAISSFTIVDSPPDARRNAEIAAEASRLIDPIVQQLAQLGPAGWERLTAEFGYTGSIETIDVRFWSGNRYCPVPVSEQIAALVRQQRQVAAQLPDGPWWGLLLTVTNRGVTTVDYDYGS